MNSPRDAPRNSGMPHLDDTFSAAWRTLLAPCVGVINDDNKHPTSAGLRHTFSEARMELQQHRLAFLKPHERPQQPSPTLPHDGAQHTPAHACRTPERQRLCSAVRLARDAISAPRVVAAEVWNTKSANILCARCGIYMMVAPRGRIESCCETTDLTTLVSNTVCVLSHALLRTRRDHPSDRTAARVARVCAFVPCVFCAAFVGARRSCARSHPWFRLGTASVKLVISLATCPM